MSIKNLLLTLALVFLIASKGIAQYKAIESFNYAEGSDLDESLGAAGNGWADGWHLHNGTADLSAISSAGIVYDDLDYIVPHTGNQLKVTLPGGWTASRYYRTLAQNWPDEAGKEYWLSFLFKTDTIPTGNTYYIAKLFYAGVDTSEIMAIGKGGGGTPFTCGSGWPGGTGSDVSNVESGTDPVWLVVKILASGPGNPDRTYMWINPDPSEEPDTNLAVVKRNSTLHTNGFNVVAIENGGEMANNIYYDEIRLGENWADVSSPIVSNEFKAIESFNYPVGTSLDTLVGTSENGWGGPWDMFDGNYEVMSVVDTGFAYGDLNFEIPHEGNLFMGANPSAWGWQRYGRYLAQTWPNEAGRVYWISCLYELKNYTDNGWALVSVFEGANERAGVGHEWGNDSLGIATYNTAGHSPYLSHDGPQWLVAKIVMTGDTLGNPVYLWVSPDPNGAEPDTTVADARGKWRLDNGFDRVAVHWGGEGVGMTMAVDEIRLGTTWADISSPLTDVSEPGIEMPKGFSLTQNYPNPFNPSTRIAYSLENAGQVRLAIYDLLGREIAVLVNEDQNAGSHEITFNAVNMTSGIYFYVLQSGNRTISRKMTLLK